jgi:CheY-like chemotaxis protein
MAIDTTLLLTVGSFAASMVLNKAVDVVFDEALERLLNYTKSMIANDRDAKDGVSFSPDSQPESTLIQDAETLYEAYPVMRRVRMVASVLEGARMLWVDDRPGNNLYERATFKSMGVSISLATSTEGAVAMLETEPVHVLISDMDRNGNKKAGLELLNRIKYLPGRPETIFYVGSVDRERGTPPGAFGITNRPDELIHYVLDVLERERV